MISSVSKKKSKQALLESAEELFARNGYSATSIRMISKLSGINSSMINYYYQSKEGLYLEIFETRLSSLNLSMQLIDASLDPPTVKIKKFLSVFVQGIKKYPHFHRLLNRELIGQDVPAVKGLVLKNLTNSFQWLNDQIRLGINVGDFKSLSPILFSLTVFTSLPALLSEGSIFSGLFSLAWPTEKHRLDLSKELISYFLNMLISSEA